MTDCLRSDICPRRVIQCHRHLCAMKLERMTVHIYTVQKGESARSVSEKFGVTEAAVLRENHIPFYEGQQVTVPVGIINIPPRPRRMLTAFYQVPDAAIYTRPDVTNIIF